MSFDPFENMPDNIKEALRDMMRRLESVDPAELTEMMSSILGPDFMDKLKDMMSKGGEGFSFAIDPNTLSNFEKIVEDLQGQTNQKKMNVKFDTVIQEEEPYSEISYVSDDGGEIIVEMPGITDVRQITWEKIGDKLNIQASNDDVKYKAEIIVPQTIQLKDMLAIINNTVFILPFKR